MWHAIHYAYELKEVIETEEINIFFLFCSFAFKLYLSSRLLLFKSNNVQNAIFVILYFDTPERECCKLPFVENGFIKKKQKHHR